MILQTKLEQRQIILVLYYTFPSTINLSPTSYKRNITTFGLERLVALFGEFPKTRLKLGGMFNRLIVRERK
jgi:hypothetical protein